MLFSKFVNSRLITRVSLVPITLVLLTASVTYAKQQGFLEIRSIPFGIGPGHTIDIMTMNPCPKGGGIELTAFGLSGASGDDVWLSEQKPLAPGEAYVIREIVPDGVIERSIAQVRMRIRCQGNLSRNAVQAAREAARFSVEIVDTSTGNTVRTLINTSYIEDGDTSGDFQ